MSRIIFDIETIGKDFDSLDDTIKDYLLRWTKTEEEIKGVREGTALSPLTGQIIAIGMLNPDTEKGVVYYQSLDKNPPLPFEEDNIRYETGTEKEIIKKFWSSIKSYKQFITFNGRGFDCPYLLIRSAIHKIKPTKPLMPNRYSDSLHVDLLDQLTFYGASKRYSLDMWCQAFGIKSPKTEMSGSMVGEFFKAGRYEDIAKYCAQDLWATKELFYYWDNFIRG